MLDQVALNQGRFNIPGIVPDARGVVLGRSVVLSFVSIDRLVAFLRIYSDEASLDDVAPTLRIVQVQSDAGARTWIAQIEISSGHIADGVVRAAIAAGGLAYTGTSKHFVKYRDARAPLGYDASRLVSTEGEFVLYGDGDPIAFRRAKELALDQLCFRLSLERDRPGRAVPPGALWISAASGISASVATYLWRHEIFARGCEIERDLTFAGRATSLLLRVEALPARMIALFSSMPGVQLFREIAENVVVELGFHHPLHLESCAQIFDRARFYLFSGAADRLDVLSTRPDLIDAAHLLRASLRGQGDVSVRDAKILETRAIEVALRLVDKHDDPRAAVACLISWADVPLLKRLVFAMPSTLLAGCTVAALDEGVLVLARTAGVLPPLGSHFEEAAPSVLVPRGHRFEPRVTPSLLAEHLGASEARIILFANAQAAPVALDRRALLPLERAVLREIAAPSAILDPAAGLARPATVVDTKIVNDDVGLLPLWGFRERE